MPIYNALGWSPSKISCCALFSIVNMLCIAHPEFSSMFQRGESAQRFAENQVADSPSLAIKQHPMSVDLHFDHHVRQVSKSSGRRTGVIIWRPRSLEKIRLQAYSPDCGVLV